MNIRLIKTSEKREILSELGEQFGISKLPYLLIETGKDKIRGFSGSINKNDIYEIGKIAPIEIIGIYLFKKEQDWRLSLDAAHLLKEQITRGIIEIDDAQFDKWLRGNDIDFEKEIPKGTLVVKHASDFIGCGKSNGRVLFNYIPKERRLKK
jgi:NOL1/NOP2/fmu family ribosome biogenesis protein